MKISLKDVLSFGGLLHADVLAGKEKLNSVFIESVTTIEVTDHLIGDWVKENQLCVTTMYAIRDDLQQQINLARILKEKKCAALVVCHVGIWIEHLDKSFISFCQEYRYDPETWTELMETQMMTDSYRDYRAFEEAVYFLGLLEIGKFHWGINDHVFRGDYRESEHFLKCLARWIPEEERENYQDFCIQSLEAMERKRMDAIKKAFRGLEQGIFVPFGHQNAPRADVERWAAAGAKLGVLHKK